MAQSLAECILFAVAQPRDCFIKGRNIGSTNEERQHEHGG